MRENLLPIGSIVYLKKDPSLFGVVIAHKSNNYSHFNMVKWFKKAHRTDGAYFTESLQLFS
jgi:hypothetical protein